MSSNTLGPWLCAAMCCLFLTSGIFFKLQCYFQWKMRWRSGCWAETSCSSRFLPTQSSLELSVKETQPRTPGFPQLPEIPLPEPLWTLCVGVQLKAGVGASLLEDSYGGFGPGV